MEFYKNIFGVSIKKCCASCKFMTHKDADLRSCTKGYRGVGKDFLCGEKWWEMNPGLQNAGKGGGKVKKYEYLHLLITKGRLEAELWASKHGGKYLTSK